MPTVQFAQVEDSIRMTEDAKPDGREVSAEKTSLPAKFEDAKAFQPLPSSKIIAVAKRGSFDINRNEIENFYYLITQRVKDQQERELQDCEYSTG